MNINKIKLIIVVAAAAVVEYAVILRNKSKAH